MKKRLGIVGEGPTDYLVLKCVIDKITGEENDYLRIQPEQNMMGEYGNGWKGVWNWCEENGPSLDKLMKGIFPNIDMIVVQIDGDVARKEKEVHCNCENIRCERRGIVFPLRCENMKNNMCPVVIPCNEHEYSPSGFREHMIHRLKQWLNMESECQNIILTVPCDSTDAWIVAAFEQMDGIEYIENPWETIISKKKDYHGIRVPGHKKNHRVYQQFMVVLEEKWKQVVELCDSAKEFEMAIKEALTGISFFIKCI